MEHLVVAPTIDARMSEMFSGTLAQCRTFIRRRARNGHPTHFCYIIRDTPLARERFRKAHHLK